VVIARVTTSTLSLPALQDVILSQRRDPKSSLSPRAEAAAAFVRCDYGFFYTAKLAVHPRVEVRLAVVNALGDVPDRWEASDAPKIAVTVLLESLRDVHIEVRRAAIRSIARIKPPLAYVEKELTDFMNREPDSALQGQAWATMTRLKS
jgi:hypothetical protein